MIYSALRGLMKNVLILFILCLSSIVFAEDNFCKRNNEVLSTFEDGTYKFKKNNQCMKIYNSLRRCEKMNLKNADLAGAKKLDCLKILKKELKNQVKIGNAVEI